MDLAGIDPETVAEQLFVHRFVPLALGDRAGQQGHGAAAVEANFRRFEPARRGALDRVRDAEAAQSALSARLRSTLLEPREIGEVERHVEALFELAAIISERETGFERHRVGRDHVAPAQFDRVDAEFVGGEIDHPLDDVCRLRAAIPAIGPHRVRVAVDGCYIGVYRRRAIDPGQSSEIGDKGVGTGLRIGADGRDRAHPQTEKTAVGIERQLGLGDVVAGLGVAEKRLGARARPFDRPPSELRGEQHQRHLVVDRRLHAEAAADVAGHHAHLVFRYLEDLPRQFRAIGVGALQGRVDRVVVCGNVIVADAAARLHCRCGNPVDVEFVSDDMRGASEGGVGRRLVTFEIDKRNIVGTVVPDPRRAGIERARCRHDRRQRLVFDRDHFRRVSCLMGAFGNDKSDVIPDPADPILDQRRIAWPIGRRTVAPFVAGGRRQVTPPRGFPIRPGQYCQHARRGLGRGRVDGADPGMRVRRAQHITERHARQHHIVDIVAAAPQQPRILEPRHRLP